MSTGSKAFFGSLVFILSIVIRLVLSDSSPIWNSVYFIAEHTYVIGLLLLLSIYMEDSLQMSLIYGIIIYKIELIAFNICLAFVPMEHWQVLSKSSKIASWLTLSIWFILFVCLLIKKKI